MRTLSLALIVAAASSQAQYDFKVVATGLKRPTGIAVAGYGDEKRVFFTEVPTPGVGGGANGVSVLRLESGKIRQLHSGEPEPVNIAVGRDGDLYWTCRSAGVILKRDAWTGAIAPVLTGLSRPTGLDVDTAGQLFFTQVPTPGVGGKDGGTNTVDVFTDHGFVFNMTRGEPEPTDIAVGSDGTSYWTCRSAGVILQRTRLGKVSLVVSGLSKPMGISINDRLNRLYWTEVPTPGVNGSNGGSNKVMEMDLGTMVSRVVHFGDPEPTDVASSRDGRIFWTCTSAGVIVEAKPIK